MAEKKWDRKGNQVVGGAVPVPTIGPEASDETDSKPSSSSSSSKKG